MRLIDAEELIDRLEHYSSSDPVKGHTKIWAAAISTVLSLDAKQIDNRQIATWNFNTIDGTIYCNMCKWSAPADKDGKQCESQYCPHCGRIMLRGYWDLEYEEYIAALRKDLAAAEDYREKCIERRKANGAVSTNVTLCVTDEYWRGDTDGQVD